MSESNRKEGNRIAAARETNPDKRERKSPDVVRPARRPVLRFSPTAWAKLAWFCLKDEIEVGGFGISRPDDSLLITEFATVRQEVSVASISFDDQAVADFFDGQVDLGRKPEQFGRLWLHTHPGGGPVPSATDEETFARVFGRCQWAVMFVLARTGKTYARLRFNVGPGGSVMVPVEVNWLLPFDGADHAAWDAEYQANIKVGLPDRFLMSRQYDFDRIADPDSLPADVGCFGAGPAGHAWDELDEHWLDLLCRADGQELEAAAEKVAARWGLIEFADWADAVMSLPPDQQQAFRAEVQAILDQRRELIADDF